MTISDFEILRGYKNNLPVGVKNQQITAARDALPTNKFCARWRNSKKLKSTTRKKWIKSWQLWIIGQVEADRVLANNSKNERRRRRYALLILHAPISHTLNVQYRSHSNRLSNILSHWGHSSTLKIQRNDPKSLKNTLRPWTAQTRSSASFKTFWTVSLLGHRSSTPTFVRSLNRPNPRSWITSDPSATAVCMAASLVARPRREKSRLHSKVTTSLRIFWRSIASI